MSAPEPKPRPHARSILSRIIRLPVWVFSIFTALSILLLLVFLHPAFINMEKEFGDQLIQQIYTSIDYVLKSCQVIAADWSAWDDLYEASVNWTDDFERTAFPNTAFTQSDLDLIIVVDARGGILYSRYRRDENGKDVIGPYTPDNTIQTIVKRRESMPRSGFVHLSDGPFFLCLNPILKSDLTGPPRGNLLVGRRIGPRLFRSVYDILRREVRIAPEAAPTTTEADPGPRTEILSDRMVLTYPLRDLRGKPVVFLRTEIGRTLFFVIFNSTLAYIVALVVSFSLVLFLLVWTFERRVLRRLRKLSSLIDENASRGSNLNECGDDAGEECDEITLLQRNYNHMIRRIRTEEGRREDIEKRMILMAKMATAGKVTAGILHEINNPIRVIKNCLWALENDPDSAPKYIDLLNSEIRHLGNITDRLTHLSRVDDSDTTEYLLNDVIDDTLLSIEAAFLQDSDCRIHVVGNEVPVPMLGNPSRIKQVFFNVIKNACEAMGFRGVVTIEIQPGDGQVTVRVMDEGLGIETTKLDTIFYPFSSDKERGMGLGLSISYTIVNSYGGRIYVDPEYKPGACFVIVLPTREKGEPQ